MDVKRILRNVSAYLAKGRASRFYADNNLGICFPGYRG